MWCNKMRWRWRCSSSQELAHEVGCACGKVADVGGLAGQTKGIPKRNGKQTRRDDDGLTRHCDGGYLPDEGSRNDGGKLSLPHAAEARSWGLLPSALQCVRSGLGAWWSTETLDRPTSPAPQHSDLPAHDWAHATGRQNITNSDRRGREKK